MNIQAFFSSVLEDITKLTDQTSQFNGLMNHVDSITKDVADLKAGNTVAGSTGIAENFASLAARIAELEKGNFANVPDVVKGGVHGLKDLADVATAVLPFTPAAEFTPLAIAADKGLNALDSAMQTAPAAPVAATVSEPTTAAQPADETATGV